MCERSDIVLLFWDKRTIVELNIQTYKLYTQFNNTLLLVSVIMLIMDPQTSTRRVTSGDEGLDDALGGGIPEGSIVLLVGGAGTGKSILGSQFLCKGRELDEAALVLLTNQNKESWISDISTYLGRDCNECLRKGKHDIVEFPLTGGKDAPIAFAQHLSRAKELNAKRLLIDSFTPIAQLLGTPTEIRKAISSIRDQLGRTFGCTTILIVDQPFGESRIGEGVEEFMADGIIELDYKELEGHRVGQLAIQKFRGTKPSHRVSAYTLDGGFKTLMPFTPKTPDNLRRFQPTQDSPGRISTGVERLDLLLDGGFPQGGVVLFDLSEKVTFRQYRLVLDPVLWNSLANNRGRTSFLALGRDYESFAARMLGAGFTEDELERLTRIMVYDRSGIPEQPFIHKLDGDFKKDIAAYRTVAEELVQATGQPILQNLNIDTVAAEYKTDIVSFLDLYMRISRAAGNLTLVILRSQASDVRGMIEPLTDLHLKMDMFHDALVLYGVKPRIELHFVQPDASRGYLMPELIRH